MNNTELWEAKQMWKELTVCDSQMTDSPGQKRPLSEIDPDKDVDQPPTKVQKTEEGMILIV